MEEQIAVSQESAKNPFAVVALKEISKVEKGLAKLKATYANVVFDVTTTKGMEQAKKARLAIREPRYALEKIRKAEASKIKAAQTALNAEAERITNEILAIETPIHEQITAEEQRKEREAAEAARLEQERVASIRAEIDRMAGTPARAEADRLSVNDISGIIAGLSASTLSSEFYKEFLPEAEFTRTKVIGELHTLIAKIQLREEEAARIKAQQEELEALRRQLAEARALLAESGRQMPPKEISEPGQSTEPPCIKSEGAKVLAVTVEAVDSGDLPASVAGDMAEVIDAIDQNERLFNDEYPGTDKVVFAVLTNFGTTEEIARRYIIEAGNDLTFQGV